MLDPLSLRVALSVVAVTLLVLTYTAVHRRDRSRYTQWWMASLIATGLSSTLYAFNGTPAQVVANPVANVAGVCGGLLAWTAARSLRHRRVPWAAAAAVLTVVLLASVMDSPASNTWAGGAAFLAGLALALTLAAREVAQARAEHRHAGPGRALGHDGSRPLVTLGFGVAALAAFYWLRAALFVAVGPDDPLFVHAVGATPTTLVVIVVLVVVTFTMTELSQFEHVHDLRMRATRDVLTGLLNREEFESQAQAIADALGGRHTIVVADIDHFKALNDTHGHATGDRALVAFAEAAELALGPRDLAARLGGEEFALFVATDSPAIARARVEAVNQEYARLAEAAGIPAPTVSYGIAIAEVGGELSEAILRADAAMYRAKRAGRDRAVVDGHA